MTKIINYNILRETDLNVLQRAVVNSLSDGWQPIGSIVVLSEHYLYAQAVVKYAPEEFIAIQSVVESTSVDKFALVVDILNRIRGEQGI